MPSSRDCEAATTVVADKACTLAPPTGALARLSVTVPVTVPFCARPNVGITSNASDANTWKTRREDIGTSEDESLRIRTKIRGLSVVPPYGDAMMEHATAVSGYCLP